eukprot:3731905-Pleurochrysis_carterae.AAC.4
MALRYARSVGKTAPKLHANWLTSKTVNAGSSIRRLRETVGKVPCALFCSIYRNARHVKHVSYYFRVSRLAPKARPSESTTKSTASLHARHRHLMRAEDSKHLGRALGSQI